MRFKFQSNGEYIQRIHMTHVYIKHVNIEHFIEHDVKYTHVIHMIVYFNNNGTQFAIAELPENSHSIHLFGIRIKMLRHLAQASPQQGCQMLPLPFRTM